MKRTQLVASILTCTFTLLLHPLTVSPYAHEKVIKKASGDKNTKEPHKKVKTSFIHKKKYNKPLTLTNNDIDEILSYRTYFSENHKFGKWRGHGPAMYVDYAKNVKDFLKTLYKSKFCVYFDWVNWKEGHKILLDHENIKQADLLTLRKLITTIIRKDRFCKGTLLAFMKDGTIQTILERLNSISKGHIQV